MSIKIEAIHQFHEVGFSKDWAEKFTPTLERVELFETILRRISELIAPSFHILELGIGPGYLAEFLLSKLPEASYEGLDFSEPMLQIAKKRLKKYHQKVHYTQADLTSNVWNRKLKQQPNIIVSTWALHDLLQESNIFSVYQMVNRILPANGLFLNGDFIKPEKSTVEYEGGRLKPSIHFDMLKRAGFRKTVCIGEFEVNVENPTTANNYSCFEAIK